MKNVQKFPWPARFSGVSPIVCDIIVGRRVIRYLTCNVAEWCLQAREDSIRHLYDNAYVRVNDSVCINVKGRYTAY